MIEWLLNKLFPKPKPKSMLVSIKTRDIHRRVFHPDGTVTHVVDIIGLIPNTDYYYVLDKDTIRITGESVDLTIPDQAGL